MGLSGFKCGRFKKILGNDPQICARYETDFAHSSTANIYLLLWYTLLKYLLYVLCRFVQYFSITSPFFWNETLDSLKHKHDELNTVFSIPNYRHLLSFWHFLDLSWVICLCSYALSSLGDGVFKKHRIYHWLSQAPTAPRCKFTKMCSRLCSCR